MMKSVCEGEILHPIGDRCFCIHCPRGFLKIFPRSFRIGIAGCGFILLLVSCVDRREQYEKTVKSGTENVPHVSELITLFPNGTIDHFLSSFGLDRDKPLIWNTEICFAGRYILTYQVDILVNYEDSRIKSVVGEPKFSLLDISEVLDDGFEIRIRKQHVFDVTDWSRIVDAGGDFSAAGIKLITNTPVAGFEKYVRGNLETRRAQPGP